MEGVVPVPRPGIEAGALDAERHQGEFGERFVQLIITAAGFYSYKPPDVGDGVDITIVRTQHDGQTPRPPNVELQVKTIRDPRIVEEEISFDMEVKHYNALRAAGPGARRFLVIVLVPGPRTEHWAGNGEDFTVFQRAAYWRDLCGEPETENSATKAVRIPLANRYTAQTVHQHMRMAREQFQEYFAGFGGAG